MPYYDEGQYRAEILDILTSVSKKKKTPCIRIIIRPTSLLDIAGQTETPIPENGYERDISLWLTEGTVDRTCEDLRRIGYTAAGFDGIDSGPHHDALVGKEIRVACEHEQDSGTGKVYDRFRLAGSGPSLEKAPLNEAGVRKLNALFGKKLASTPPIAAVATPPPPPEPPKPDPAALEAEIDAATAGDDEVPF